MVCYSITVIGGTVALTCGGAVTGGPVGKNYLFYFILARDGVAWPS